MRQFMFSQVGEKDLQLLVDISGVAEPDSTDDIPLLTLIPAFMLSELKRAFQMGFLLFVPFLVIDMVVASILMAMGMMMLPPIIISLPFKILLFVLVDGWSLVIGSLVQSFG
jgi:flagellar biosynthetic protein FliP